MSTRRSVRHVSVCAACLATGVRMHSMGGVGVLEMYRLLTGRQVGDEISQQLCWECAALVNKFNLFRGKCERAYLLLQDIYRTNNEVTEEDIRAIDRLNHRLSSFYGLSGMFICDSENNCSDAVKLEPSEQDLSINADAVSQLSKIEVKLIKDDGLLVKLEPSLDLDEIPSIYAESVASQREEILQKRKRRKLLHRSVQEVFEKKCKTKKKSKRKYAGCFKATRVSLTQEQMMQSVRDRETSKGYRAARHKCNLCYKGFMEEKTYNNHMRLHDPASGELQCDICKVRLRSRLQAHCHISGAHMTQYRCRLCPNVASNKAAAKKHYDWHRGVTYTCDICGAVSTKLTTHLSHVRIKHPSQHICGACGDSFVSARGLRDHTAKMHPRAPAAAVGEGKFCAACDVRFASEQIYTRHILVSPRHALDRANIPHGCRECGARLPSAAALAAHARELHPPRGARPSAPRRPLCAQCGAVQASPRAYWAHFRRAHPGEIYPLEVSMPFICESCGKGFKCKSLLATHRNVHTGTRNHKCNICPKSFYKPESLRVHLVSHSDNRPFVCEVCSKGFKLKWALQRHMRVRRYSSRNNVN